MKCWNCGLDTMHPSEDLGKGWFKCSDCKATWTEVPVPGGSALGGTWKDASNIRHYHPHPLPKGKKAKK